MKKLLHDRIDLYRVLRYHPQSGTAPFYGPLPKNIEKDEMMYEEFDANILNEADTVGQSIRAPDKREYLVIIRDNFCYFCIKPLL